MNQSIQTSLSSAIMFLCVFSGSASDRPNIYAQSQARPARVLEPLAAKIEPSQKIVYKSVGGRDLELHVFQPSGHDPATDRRPCILIIHGGGWTGGEPRVFYTIADHYAKQGMLAISLQYRLIDAKAGAPKGRSFYSPGRVSPGNTGPPRQEASEGRQTALQITEAAPQGYWCWAPTQE